MQNFTMQAEAVIDPGAEITARARLIKEDGSVMAAADMSSISMRIFDTQDLATAIAIAGGGVTTSTVATSTVTGLLETGGNWSEDDDGYNFSHTYDTSTFLTRGHRYKQIYKFTTAASGIIYLPIFLAIRNINF
jgi:hypothetical protein